MVNCWGRDEENFSALPGLGTALWKDSMSRKAKIIENKNWILNSLSQTYFISNICNSLVVA